MAALRRARLSRRRPSGFALLSALFLIVVLAALAAVVVTVSTVQHSTFSQQLLAARARYAAHAGMEWAAHKVVQGSGCPLGTHSFTVANGVSVWVRCERVDHYVPRGSVPYYLVDVEARGNTAGQPDVVSRRLQGKLLGASS